MACALLVRTVHRECEMCTQDRKTLLHEKDKRDIGAGGRWSGAAAVTACPTLVECLRFFRNKIFIPIFFSQTWKKRNLEIVCCTYLILFLF
jgi:hypothetical protein